MHARLLIAGVALAGAAAAGLPAVAQAAPVVPAQAILAAHEFPLGSTGYESNQTVEKAPSKSSGTTECDRKSDELDRAAAGARSADASANRGDTVFLVSILERPLIAQLKEFIRICGDGGEDRGTPLAAPHDLARYQPRLTSSLGGRFLQAGLDVRGTSVIVLARNGRAPADFDGFWQTLRAQVGKIERQP